MKLSPGIVWKILVRKSAKDRQMLYFFLSPFFFTFPTILFFVIAKYDAAIRIRPMRSSLSRDKRLLKCHRVFLRSENSGRQVNYLRILLYITTGIGLA